jgi:hypothetical protein
MNEPEPKTTSWIVTEATVTTCRYQSPGLSVLAFGFQTTRKFLITFDYYAHGRLYSGQFQSATAVAQNQRLPISYNPLNPEQNSLDRVSGSSSTHPPLIAIGIIGSIILSLLWLAVLRSCH